MSVAIAVDRLPNAKNAKTKTAELMHRLCWITNENPMDDSLGGHIHLCYPCERSGCNFTEPNGEGEKCGDFEYGPGEITIEPPMNGDMECDCVVDPEDGSTITACALAPARRIAQRQSDLVGFCVASLLIQRMLCLPAEPRAFGQFEPCERLSHGETRCAECRRHE